MIPDYWPHRRSTLPVLLIGALGCLPCAAFSWPTVAAQDVAIGVNTSSARIDIDVQIRATDGTPAYRLICRGGNEKFLQELLDAKHIFYVPDMMCVLNPDTADLEESLLAESALAAWHTRGQFRWPDLVGSCGSYPEYGRVRHFRLRGMELTLSATDVRVRGRHLDYFVFNIKVRSDASVQSEGAEPSGFLYPTENCKEVRKGVEPRLCRNAKFDLVPCAELPDRPGGKERP